MIAAQKIKVVLIFNQLTKTIELDKVDDAKITAAIEQTFHLQPGSYGVERSFQETYKGSMGVDNLFGSFELVLKINAYQSQVPIDLRNNMLSQILKKEVKNFEVYSKLNAEPIFRLAFQYRKELLLSPFFGEFNRVNTALKKTGAMSYLEKEQQRIRRGHSSPSVTSEQAIVESHIFMISGFHRYNSPDPIKTNFLLDYLEVPCDLEQCQRFLISNNLWRFQRECAWMEQIIEEEKSKLK